MISTLQVRRLPAAFVAGVWLLGTPIHARTADPEPTTYWYRLQDKDPLERVWEALRLYDDPENSVIQAFSLVGRYQGQYWSVNAE